MTEGMGKRDWARGIGIRGQLAGDATLVRGRQDPQVTMLTFIDLENRVPPDHPLRTIKAPIDRALVTLSAEFDQM